MARINRFTILTLTMSLGTALSFAVGGVEPQAASVDPFAKHLEIEWLGYMMQNLNPEESHIYLLINEMEDKFNTTFKWPDLVDWSNADKVNAQLSTGKIPEFCAILETNIEKLYSDGMLRTWSFEDIKEKMPNTARLLDKTGGWNYLRVPGKDELMGIAQMNYKPLPSIMVSFYRLDWMERLGIKPKGALVELVPDQVYWSNEGFDLEEQRAILNQFVDSNASGKNITYGLGPFYAATFTAFGGAVTPYNEYPQLSVDTTVMEDDELKFGFATNAYREALQWFNTLYNDGILTKETVLAGQDFQAFANLWNAGTLGYAQTHYRYLDVDFSKGKWHVPFEMLMTNEGSKVLIVPMEHHPETGRFAASTGGSAITPSIPTVYLNQIPERAALASAEISDEKFDRAMRIFDWVNSTQEGFMRNHYGVDGINYRWEGEPWKSGLISSDSGPTIKSINPDNPPGPEYSNRIISSYWLPWTHEITKRNGALWSTIEDDLLSNQRYRNDYLYSYRYDFLNKTNVSAMRKNYGSALATIIQDYTINFILGEIDLDSDWTDYLAALNRSGMNAYLQEIAKAPLVSAYMQGRIEY